MPWLTRTCACARLCLRLEGFEVGGALEVDEGAFGVSRLGVVLPEKEQGVAVEGVHRDDLLEDRDGRVASTLRRIDARLQFQQAAGVLRAQALAEGFARLQRHGLGFVRVAACRERVHGAQRFRGRLRGIDLDRADVRARGEVRACLVDVNVSEQIQRIRSAPAHTRNHFEVFGGLQRLVHSEIGVGLEHPELGLVGVALDENPQQARRFLEFFLLDDAADEPQPPIEARGIEEQRVAVCGLGGEEIRPG